MNETFDTLAAQALILQLVYNSIYFAVFNFAINYIRAPNTRNE
jgi:hypothetical protein